MKNLIFGLWLLGYALYGAGGQSCVYKECTCSGNYTWCTSLGLNTVPPLYDPGTVQHLYFDWNSMTTLHAKTLPPNLVELSLMNNPLNTIDVSTFDESTDTLQSLSMSGAKFSTFPDAVSHLRKLKELHILDSSISDWNMDAMQTIGVTVNSLYLEDCKIDLWPAWLNYFDNLTELSFQSNAISSIPDEGLITAARTLTSLNLQNNSLTRIPEAMYHMSALQELYLQKNRISDVRWLPPNSTLIILSVNNNQLFDADQLSRAVKPYARSLTTFDLDFNSLTSVPDLSFLSNVKSIDFSHNQIYNANSGILSSNLSYVNLNYNFLPSLPIVLMTLKGISDIDLNNNRLTRLINSTFPSWAVGASFGYNLITELTDDSFPSNSALLYLNLNDNSLRSISSQAFKNLPLLNYLNLHATRLTRLPEALLSGSGLTTLDFTDSPSLVCTCREKRLTKFITSLQEFSVIGSCGETSIYQFFLTFAPGCPN